MLGIVILNYQTWQLTIECVRRIKKNFQQGHKIFIVDNASPNGSYARLCETFQDDSTVVCLLSEENKGYARGNNIGISECKKNNIEYALITNNDVEFCDHAIQRMQETLTENSNAVLVSPKILSKEGKINSFPFSGFQTLSQYLGVRDASKLHIDVENTRKPIKVCWVSGCCLMIDVDKFINMGGFDPGTFMYCEEGTVARQAWLAGHEIIFEPRARVIHAHGASTGKKNIFIDSNVLCSSLFYWRKYEAASNIQLYIIYYFFMSKMLFKIILRRIDAKGMKQAFKHCICELKNVLQMKRGIG